MSRFVAFPALFAAWFGAIQCGLTVLSHFSLWLTLRLISSNVRLNVFPLSNWSSPYFFWSCAMGATVGMAFAAFDIKFHPHRHDAEETLPRLLSSLLKSGAIAVGLILLYYGALEVPLSLHLSRIPQSLHTPYRDVGHWTKYLPLLILAFSLIWSMKEALHD